MVRKVVSGGQTGADRGALDAAIELGISHGGFCPRHRRAEDGPIPLRYQLQELESPDYPARTEANVRHSDGTLLLGRGKLEGGSALTLRVAAAVGKPYLHIDLAKVDAAEARRLVSIWIRRHDIEVLNVAGPRESSCRRIRKEVYAMIKGILAGQNRRTTDGE